jgi:hypothetical protein
MTFLRLEKKFDFKSFKYPRDFAKLPHWKIPLKELKELGVNESTVIQHLKDLYYMFQDEFFQKQELIINEIPLTLRQLRNCLDSLVKNEYLFVERKGHNRNNYYTINYTKTKLEGERVKESVDKLTERVNLHKEENKQKEILKGKDIVISAEDLLCVYENIENIEIDLKLLYDIKDKHRIKLLQKDFSPKIFIQESESFKSNVQNYYR